MQHDQSMESESHECHVFKSASSFMSAMKDLLYPWSCIANIHALVCKQCMLVLLADAIISPYALHHLCHNHRIFRNLHMHTFAGWSTSCRMPVPVARQRLANPLEQHICMGIFRGETCCRSWLKGSARPILLLCLHVSWTSATAQCTNDQRGACPPTMASLPAQDHKHINTEDKHGNSALDYLTFQGPHLQPDVYLIPLLLEKGANSKPRGTSEVSPFALAIESGALDIAKQLQQVAGTPESAPVQQLLSSKPRGSSLACLAAHAGKLGSLKYLASLGVDLNAPGMLGGVRGNALLAACMVRVQAVVLSLGLW